MSEPARVAVCIVTHDSARDLPACLEAVDRLIHRPLEVVVVDCGSGDDSVGVARRHAPPGLPMTVVPLGENLGFSGGMNRAIERTDAPWILSLNPDARPSPDFLSRALAGVGRQPAKRVAAVTGRLLRPGEPAVLDACGMRLTWTWRHLDRASGAVDRGQLDRPESVFGASGAAALYARSALDDVAVDGEIFLEEFHSYREDAELSFRFQERGWAVLYEPEATAIHARHVVPARRRQLSEHINRHSLKNRYLLRAYHQTPGNFFATLGPTLFRDLGALLWVLAVERSSAGAYAWLWRNRGRIAARRRALRDRRTSPPRAVNRWFTRDGEAL